MPKHEFGMYSLEKIFSDIRSVMLADINVDVQVSTFKSQGLWRRVFNMVEAVFHQGDVNHITGDVHFLTFLLKKQRTVLTILDCVGLGSLSEFKQWMLWFLWYWLPMHRVSYITVISEATKQELLSLLNYDPAKIKVIHCSVSDCFRADEQPFDTFCPRILQVGTRAHNKNIERVAIALAGINCIWSIIGTLSPSQIGIIERHGIDYENHVGLSEEALVEQYKLADMLVFASTYEGFGLPIVEANAVGRPVVTSNLCSMPEVAGRAACLVNPYDIESIRSGILRVIEDADYRALLVKEGFLNVKRFRPVIIAEQYAQLYRSCYANLSRGL